MGADLSVMEARPRPHRVRPASTRAPSGPSRPARQGVAGIQVRAGGRHGSAGRRGGAVQPACSAVIRRRVHRALLRRPRHAPVERDEDPAPEQVAPLPVANRERVAVPACADGVAIRGQPRLTEGARVANRIDLEEVLIVEPEPDHPCGQLDRVGYASVARPRVQLQQLAGQIPNQPVRVVRMHDDLDDVTDRPLQQFDQRPRRRLVNGGPQLGGDRLRGVRPLCALAVTEEPTRTQAAIHLGAQLRQIARGASGDQTHLPLNVTVTIHRRQDDLTQFVDRQSGDQLLERRLRSDARSSTGHRPVAR